MHVRVTKTSRGSKTYRSVQLAQSYRSEEGKPVTRVIASLGNLSDLEIENLRQAVAASRNHQAVVVASQTPPRLKVKQSLAYLDVATCLQLWQRWGLTELINELGATGARDVSVGEVIAALTVQRCVAPASKLEASRWYPRTALPELQRVRPEQFNNTRVHRALDVLAAIEAELQERLARHVEAEQGQFVNFFLDCTDTWFVGRGPAVASHGLTKEGLIRRKIGIALMCDQRGFPLRWATVEGNHNEVHTMLDMVDAASKLAWADKLPVVVDRAMGQGVTIEGLLARDIHFVTAIPAPEIANYSQRIPLGVFEAVDLGAADRNDKQTLQQLQRLAVDAGFQQLDERYLLDLGVIAKGDGGEEVPASWLAPSRAVAVVTAARTVQRELDSGCVLEDLAERYQCAEHTLRRWLSVLALREDLQQRILDGEVDHVAPQELRRIAKLSPTKQVAAFAKLSTTDVDQSRLLANKQLARFFRIPPQRVRAIAMFSPANFIEKRQAVLRAVRRIEELVATTNETLRAPRSRSSPTRALGRVEVLLRKESLTDVFDVSIVETNHAQRQVSQLLLQRNDKAWTRRRQTDGVTLIVSHANVLRSATDLASLYFAKDMVEKDFQAIKSVLALRPVNHHTDSKVRAHVSLCMLALLLQRTFEQRLRKADLTLTARSALGLLESGRLNLFAGRASVYSVTEPDPDQLRILAALDLPGLADDARLPELLRPR